MIRKVNSIISSAVLTAFLLNIFLFDVGFAQEAMPKNSIDTLAPAARTDDMFGLELRDQGMILMWFKACAALIEAKQLRVTLETIKDPAVIDDDFFSELSGFQIFRHEAARDPETGVITLMARKLDHTGKTYTIEYNPMLGFEGIKVYPVEKRRVANNGAKRIRAAGRYVKAPEGENDTANEARPLSESDISAENPADIVARVIEYSPYLKGVLKKPGFFTFRQFLDGCETFCKEYRGASACEILILRRENVATAGLSALVNAGMLNIETKNNIVRYSAAEAFGAYLEQIRQKTEGSDILKAPKVSDSENEKPKPVEMSDAAMAAIVTSLTGKNGLRSYNPEKAFNAALALANLAGQATPSDSVLRDVAKSLIGPEGLQNRYPEHVFQAALALANLSGAVKLNEIGLQAIIDSLIGRDGLQGADPFRAYQATQALTRLAANGILANDKADKVINSLTGKNGLQSPEPWRVLHASIALAGFADYPGLNKDIPRSIVDLLTAKTGILRPAPLEVFQSSLVLARFGDKEMLNRDAKRIMLKSLVGEDGLRSGNIASTFRASIAFTELAGKGMIGKDVIKALEIFLKSGDGLKSQSKFYAFLAALDIANTADRMELDNDTLRAVASSLTGNEGLQSQDSWRVLFASEALANLKARLNKLPKQPRSVDGTFGERPGKGPLAARLVIGVSPYIQGLLESQGFFTLNDYKIGYEEVRRRSPELNFERMAHYWQKTARRDLAGLDIELHASGILMADRTEKELRYRITKRFHETLRLIKKGSENVASRYTSGIATTLKSLKPSAAGIARTVQEEKYKIFRIGSDEDYFEITDFGAAVTRLVAGGKNMIWQGAGGEKVRQDGNAFAVPGGIPVMIPANGRTPLGDMLKQDGQTPVNILKSSLARPVDGVNPLDNEACKHLLHGITDKVRWHMRNAENDSITFLITSEEVVLDVEGAKTLADIIGKVLFEQTYRLKDGRLTSELTMTNMDVAPVVLGGGYHPFYQLDDLEDWTIQVKAGKIWAKDSTPLDINAKPEDVVRGGEWDFSAPKPLRYGLEVVLSGLESEASGNIEIVLHNTKTEEDRRISFDKEHFPHVLIWVPLKDKAPAPGVFSVEPLITIPNGRNMFLSGNKEVGALVLQPGESKTIIWGLQVGARSVENAPAPADEDITVMTEIASQTGQRIPTDHANRYTLLVPREFFNNGELDEHKNIYGDRFNLDAVSGATADQFIKNVLGNPNFAKDRTIVLLPDELANDKFEVRHYESLKAAGIRFAVVDRQQLLDARSRLLNPRQRENEFKYRKQFWTDTYVIMLLMRVMDEDTDPSSPIYRLLSFYLKTHFSFTDKIALEAYIMAIAKNDIGNLLKGILAYRPIQVYDKPDYGTIAATLVSA